MDTLYLTDLDGTLLKQNGFYAKLYNSQFAP